MQALKKEREDILGRMDMTRQRYRAEMMINRKLAAQGHTEKENLRFAHDVQSEVFPRSMTMRILTRHPYAAVAAAAAFLLLGPRDTVQKLGRSAAQYAPGLLARTKYGPLVQRLLPHIQSYLSRRGAQREVRRQAEEQAALHAVHRFDGGARETGGQGEEQRFERTLHREHLQTKPTIH